MKVVISAKPMQSGSKNRGIGAYTRELVHALTKKYTHDKFIPTSHDYYDHGADLVHFPFFDPFFLTLPLFHPLPTIVTIHDLIPLKYPKHFPRGLRGRWKWMIQRMAARRADHIITDSNASKRDIARIMGIHENKISVVPLAPASDKLDPKMKQVTKKEYGLPDRYILYVGDINWNKNVTGLIRSFAELQDTLHLVLVGKAFVGSNIPERRAVLKAMQESGCSDRIHMIGYVPSHHLPAIYAQAVVYVQPSWDEGFGLPILEAMKVDCPVASSDRGSLPEVGGDAVAYFDPAKNMADIIKKVIESSSLRETLTQKGREQLKKFSWAGVARQTRTVYEYVLKNKH